MKRKDDAWRLKMAGQSGEATAARFGFTQLPVDPFAIAEKEEILVKPKPNTAKGVSGMLVRANDNFGIMYATDIDNDGFQRFSIAHELGHYFLDGHIDHVLPPGSQAHTSRAGFASGDIYELEADHFAAGLLMPAALFRRAIGQFKDGLAAIVGLSALGRTSLLATAIRYAQSATCAAAAVVSEGKHIDYGFLSDTLRDAPNIEWPKRNAPLPLESLTIDFNQDPTKIARSQRERGKIDLSDWFAGVSVEGWEEIIGLGGYGKTLTIITCPDYPTEDEIEDEEQIEQSLTPRFPRR